LRGARVTVILQVFQQSVSDNESGYNPGRVHRFLIQDEARTSRDILFATYQAIAPKQLVAEIKHVLNV
jgi:hypothetical protein